MDKEKYTILTLSEISDRADFTARKFIRAKERHYIMIKKVNSPRRYSNP